MKKDHTAILILLILLATTNIAWTIHSQPQEKQWFNIGRWDGTQRDYNMTTEQFSITGTEWRISWSCTKVVGGSAFKIIVYDVYTDSEVKTVLKYSTEALGGDSYLNVKGRFYLHIFVYGTLGDWVVSINEYK